MAARPTSPTIVKLTDKNIHQPIKELPAVLELPHDIIVENVKILIARKIGFRDYNRVGLFDPINRHTLKNRQAIIWDDINVTEAREIVVKDLGMLRLLHSLVHRPTAAVVLLANPPL